MSQEYNRPTEENEQKAGEAPKVLNSIAKETEAGNERDVTTGQDKKIDSNGPSEPGNDKASAADDTTTDDKHSAEAKVEEDDVGGGDEGNDDDDDDDWKEVRICNIN